MKKYPYTYKEFETEVKIQYLKDYCKNNTKYMEELFKSENLDEVIKENYNGIKDLYENETQPILKDLKEEVRSTVACLGMF